MVIECSYQRKFLRVALRLVVLHVVYKITCSFDKKSKSILKKD